MFLAFSRLFADSAGAAANTHLRSRPRSSRRSEVAVTIMLTCACRGSILVQASQNIIHSSRWPRRWQVLESNSFAMPRPAASMHRSIATSYRFLRVRNGARRSVMSRPYWAFVCRTLHGCIDRGGRIRTRVRGHSHALSWYAAGWKTREVDLEVETLVFSRVSSPVRKRSFDIDEFWPPVPGGTWPPGFIASREQMYDESGRLTGGPQSPEENDH